MKEKRGTARIALNMPVDLKRLDFFTSENNNPDGSQKIELYDEVATAEDLSPDGIFIATKHQTNYPEGSDIEVVLTFPSREVDGAKTNHATVTIKGEVMWSGYKVVEEERRRVSGIGVRFKGMDSETLEQVFALYERLHSKLH